jgi:hypothetical protein
MASPLQRLGGHCEEGQYLSWVVQQQLVLIFSLLVLASSEVYFLALEPQIQDQDEDHSD